MAGLRRRRWHREPMEPQSHRLANPGLPASWPQPQPGRVGAIFWRRALPPNLPTVAQWQLSMTNKSRLDSRRLGMARAKLAPCPAGEIIPNDFLGCTWGVL